MLDVIIIGAGPIGLACGIEAKQNKLNYLILDKGCLVNSIYNYPLNMTFFSTSDKLEIGGIPFISHGNKPNRFEALEYYRRVCNHYQLQLNLYENVNDIEKLQTSFEVITNKASYKTKNLILATGFYDSPYLMNIEGESLPKVKHYYDEPHPYYGQNIVVVGTGNSAIDVALETYRKGANVTMVVREECISNSVKYWVRPDIENRISSGEIKAFFNSNIKKITDKEVFIQTQTENFWVKNDFVLAMTGYKPNYSLLESLGVNILEDEFKTPFFDEKTNQSNIKGVYLAGVVCGGLKTNKWFIENSRTHAQTIIKDIVL